MLNKKKLLVLISAVTAMAVGSLIAVVSTNGQNSFNEKPGDVTNSFEHGYVKGSPGSDEYYSHGYVNMDPNKTINVKMSGVTVQQVEENYIVYTDYNNYSFIYNLEDSPIRGISSLSIYSGIDYKSGSAYVRAYIYYSYFPLTIDNILNGQYQDLKVVNFNKTISNYMDIQNVEGNLDAQYFLIALSVTGANVQFYGLIVDTPCDEFPPEIEEKGNYPHSYGEEVDAIMPNDFPFIGNGSFMTFPEEQLGFSGYDIIGPQRSGKQEQFFDALVASGFQKVSKYMMYDIYQKFAHDDLYYTVVDVGAYNEFDDYEITCFAYMGLGTSMAGKDTWPMEDITSFFDDASFTGDLTDIGFSNGSRYLVMTDEEISSQKSMTIQVTFPDDISIETAKDDVSAFTAFKNKLATLGYFASSDDYSGGSIDDGSYDFEFRYVHPSLKYLVIGAYSYSRDDLGNTNILCGVVFSSYSMSDFPTDELISYFEGDYFPAIPGDAKYRSNTFYGSDVIPQDFDVQKTKRYITSGLSAEDRTSYLSSLEDAGWTVTDSTAMKIYSSTSLPFGAKFRFIEHEHYTELVFQTGVASRYVSDFRSAVDSALNAGSHTYGEYEAAINFSKDLSSMFSTNRFYYSNTGELEGTIICRGVNQFVLDAILDRLTYVESIGHYIHHSEYNDFCIIVSYNLEDNDVLTLSLSMERYDEIEILSDLVDAETVNATMDTYFNDRGVTSDLERYHVHGEGNIFSCEFGVKTDGLVTVVLDSYSDLETIRNGYISALTSSGDVKYSSFLGRYVDTSNGVGVEISEIDTLFGKYAFGIAFTFGNGYRDYVSYDELDLSNFQHIDLIEPLDVDSGKHFVLQYVDSNYMGIYLDPAFYESYRLSAMSNGYTGNQSQLTKVDEDGNSITLRFTNSNHCVDISVEMAYYHSKTELSELYPSFDTFFSNFVLPAENNKNYHCDYLSNVYCALYIYNVNLDDYAALLESSGYSGQGNEYVKVNDTQILTVDIYGEALYYNIHTLNKISYTELLDELVNNYSVDPRRLDRFVVSESFGNNVNINSYSDNYFSIIIVDSEFNVENYKSELESAGFNKNEKSDYYQTADSATIIEFRSYYGLTEIFYSDRREFYDSYETVVSQILDRGMSEKRLSYFVAPNQEGASYLLLNSSDYVFDIRYNSETFDLDAYLAKLDASDFELINPGDDNYYDYRLNDIQITIDANFSRIRYYNSDYIGLSFAEVKAAAIDQGYNPEKLVNLVDPNQEGAEFDTYIEQYDDVMRIRWIEGKFDVEAYKTTLIETGGYTFDEGSSYKNYYHFHKGGYQIEISLDYREIYFSAPMTASEMLEKAVDYGFDSSAISRLNLPDTSTLEVRGLSVYGSHEFYIDYAEETVDVGTYKAQLETAGFVLNESMSDETYFYYEKDGNVIAINTAQCTLYFVVNYTFEEIKNVVLSVEGREWVNDFVDPEQDNVFYSNLYVNETVHNVSIKYLGDFDPDEYIAKLIDLGFVNEPDTSTYSNGFVEINVFTDSQRLDFKGYKVFSDLKDDYLSLEYCNIDLYNALIDPEQDNVGYIADIYDDDEIYIDVNPLYFNPDAYCEILEDNEFTKLSDGDTKLYQRGNVVIEFHRYVIHLRLTYTYDEMMEYAINEGYQPYEGTVEPTSLNDASFYYVQDVSQTHYTMYYVGPTFDIEAYCNAYVAAGFFVDDYGDSFHIYNQNGVDIYISVYNGVITFSYNN